ncbi:MAG: sulfate ABC transporter substrate-binding protein, partial [Actinomycetia bacterium]|nr:sulfate ABC transporter substrate-binding protein [Actinomycetes bacterium]
MKFTTRPGRRRAVAMWAVASTVLVACGGGAGDIVGADAAGDADTTLILVAYAVAEPGWSNIV